jgi:hypothetical protein
MGADNWFPLYTVNGQTLSWSGDISPMRKGSCVRAAQLIFKDLVPAAKKTQFASMTTINWLMKVKEIMAVNSEIRNK